MADFSNVYAPALIGTAADGDLLVEGGDLVLTSDVNPRGENPVKQDILRRLRTFLGECFMDITLGVPYLQQLLGRKTPPSTWDAVLQNVVLQTPGVVQLSTWQTNFDSRARVMHLAFTAVTAAGPVVYNAAIDLNAA